MKWDRIKYDGKYILLNCVVNKIPSWFLRRSLYKLLGLSIGAGSRIGIGTVVLNPEHISIGCNTIINEYCHLDGRGGLEIGNNTSISIYTKIITASHYKNSASFEYYCENTNIGDRVWIGAGAIILNGSTIQNECIIGAGCVFKGMAGETEIYVGNPAVMIKKRVLEGLYELTFNPYFR